MKKYAFLANSTFAIPAFQAVAQAYPPAAIGLAEPLNDGTQHLHNMAGNFSLPVRTFSKNEMGETLRSWLEGLQIDAVLVLTFPFKIPKATLERVPDGFFNFHFGLLPQYRGSEPLFWEIINREPFGAVSVHQMDEGWDTGPLVFVDKVPIGPLDTYGTHKMAVARQGSQSILKLLQLLDGPAITRTPQDEDHAGYYSKPDFNAVAIDWNKMAAIDVQTLIRACNPWNKGAFAFIRGMPLKILSVTATDLQNHGAAAGTLLKGKRPGLFAACRDGQVLEIDMVYLDEDGYFTGAQFADMGIGPPERFVPPPAC